MSGRLLPLALSVSALLGAPALAQVDDMVNAAFGRANDLKNAFKYDEADKEYQRALEAALRYLGEEHKTTALLLAAVGELHERQGKFALAYKAYLRCLAIRQKIHGPGHTDVAVVLASVASAAMELGKFDEAEKRLSRALEIREKAKGAESKEVADTLNDMAILASRQGKSEEAVKLNRKSLSIRVKTEGPESAGAAQSQSNLGLALHEMEDWRGAEEAQRQALKIREKSLGPKHPTTAESLNNLALLLKDVGRFKEAEELNRRALEIRELTFGPDHYRTVSTVRNLAVLCAEQGRQAEAAGLFRRALAAYDRTFGQEHPAVVETLNSLALLELARGRSNVAEPILQRALVVAGKVHGPNHEAVAGTLNNLANVALAAGQPAEAEKHFGKCLKVREALLGPEHELVAASLTDLANAALQRQLLTDARAHLERALSVREKIYGQEHPALGETLAVLADIAKRQGERQAAEAFYRRNLAIMDRAVGEEHVAYAEAQALLAAFFMDSGRQADAETGLRKAVDVYERALGKEHPQVAQALTKLGQCLQVQRQFTPAREVHQRARAINQKALGADHPSATACLDDLAQNAWLDGNQKDALAYFDEQRRAVRRFLLREFPFLTEVEQRAYLASAEGDCRARALAFACEQRTNDEVARRSAEWLLNAKGVAFEARTLRDRLTLVLNDAEARSALAELQDLRIRETTLLQHEGGPATMNARKARSELRVRRRLLEQALASGPAAAHFSPWLELGAVRKAIPKDGVLVDIARVDPPRLPAKAPESSWVAPHYVAWVIKGAGSVAVVDLGPAQVIDDQVRAVRQAMRDAPQRIREVGEDKAEREMRLTLATLTNSVIKPMANQLKGALSLVISPDGDLWQVPWAALPLEDGSYLVESTALQLVLSGRDLLPGPVLKVETSPALIVADPEPGANPGLRMPQLSGMEAVGKLGGYDVTFVFGPAGKLVVRIPDGDIIGQGVWRQQGDSVLMETEKSLYTGKITSGELRGERRFKDQSAGASSLFSAELGAELDERMPAGNALRMQTVSRVRSDVDATSERMKRLTGAPVKVLTKGQATEAALKAGLRPKALVLNAPGFGLPANSKPAPGDDPWLRYGLLLAGHDKSTDSDPGQEDGKLSVWEMAHLDCRGTLVAVLSDPDLPDGSATVMHQALQMAGARSSLTTLWPADAQLINRFYIRLEIGAPAATALMEAQRNTIEQRREAGAATHPYYWAAPIVTGK